MKLGSLAMAGLNLKELPDTGMQWSSLKNGMEFQPAADLSPMAEDHLRRLTSVSSTYAEPYIEGAETYYDDYAQAWRALGFYVDCENVAEQGDQNEDADNADNVVACQRYLLWAAYIDEGYSGNGASEYKYFDRHSNRWDSSSCIAGERCVAMDCHLPSSNHFSLLGFFKEPQYEDFIESLLSYQGDCVWTDEEYNFMMSGSAMRDILPSLAEAGCSKSVYVDNGNYIYYTAKPMEYGDLGVGLYTDSSCVQPYAGNTLSPQTVLQTMVCGVNAYDQDYDEDFDETLYNKICQYYNATSHSADASSIDAWSLSSELEQWNEAMDAFKQCQPCMTVDLTSVVAGLGYKKNSDGYRYYSYQDDDNHNDNKNFVCQSFGADDDDNQGQAVNQCKKMSGNMESASWRDVELAGAQGSITSVLLPSSLVIGKGLTEKRNDISDLTYAWLFLSFSIVLLAFTLFRFKNIKEDADFDLEEPLVPSTQAVTV
eukprot:Nitzschia sp. Nitz4//scaffold151_size53849//46947//48605//NITZ4_006731-RA/size53849-snap-gene-0.36-mRNA-1//-1//CDS//3329537168//5088//frame0